MCTVKGRNCFMQLLCAFPIYSQDEREYNAGNKLKTILALTKRNRTAADSVAAL